MSLFIEAGQVLAGGQRLGPGNNQWHEHVVRWDSGLTPPSFPLQIVLLAGTIPPPDQGGTDSSQGTGQDDTNEQKPQTSESTQSGVPDSPENEFADLAGQIWIELDVLGSTVAGTFDGHDSWRRQIHTSHHRRAWYREWQHWF